MSSTLPAPRERETLTGEVGHVPTGRTLLMVSNGTSPCDDTDPPAAEPLDDGYGPDAPLAEAVDRLEERVLSEADNPLLSVEHDADAAAVADDTEFDGDDAQPPT